MKKITVLILGFIFLFSSFGIVLAQTPTPQVEVVSEVNSFEAFWPMAAGKTVADNLYGLKRFKEGVRGVFIFGTPQKADYKVFLAVKRVLEAEKLIKDDKKDLAKKTLEVASKDLSDAAKLIEDAKASKTSVGGVSQNISTRAVNIEKLARYLATKDNDVKDKLLEVASKAKEVNSKF